MKKFLRVLAIAGLVVLALAAISTASNLIMGGLERSNIEPYGETVTLESGDVNVSVTGDGEQAVVLLSGYGYSDLDVAERTVENISGELHDALVELDVREPILVAHSLAGIDSMDYVNRFPGEVSALVTIDSSVPEDFAVPPQRSSWERVLATSGLVRWAIMVDPAIAAPTAPAGVYADEELEQIRLMNIWNYANRALIDENNRTAENFEAVADLSYPVDLPVLAFVSQQSVDDIEQWLPAHERQLEQSNRSIGTYRDGPQRSLTRISLSTQQCLAVIVDIATMAGADDRHQEVLVLDLVDDTVGPAPHSPGVATTEFRATWRTWAADQGCG